LNVAMEDRQYGHSKIPVRGAIALFVIFRVVID